MVVGVHHLHLGGDMIDAPTLQAYLETGVSAFAEVNTYVIGGMTFSDDAFVIRPGAMVGGEGLDPKTLEVTIVVGGDGGPGAALKAAAMDRSLSGAALTWTKTIVGGGSALMFTGTVQRPEPSSTEVRIVAMTGTVDLDAIQLPTHVILPAEFPEIPAPENYNIR